MLDEAANPNPASHPSDCRLQWDGVDPRADDRTRTVVVEREAVAIRRSVAGVAMTIRVRAAAHRGVTLNLVDHADGGVRREARLAHRDPDLSVLLADDEDETVVEALWRDWASFFGLPPRPAAARRTDGPMRRR
jgi:hypothetical protein